MDTNALHQILSRLTNQEGELAALRSQLAAYRAERAGLADVGESAHGVRTGGVRRGRIAGALALALLGALAPLALLAAPLFSDLGQAGEAHRTDIQRIGDLGITTGFADPASSDPNVRIYDPKGAVSREQMASFLARTAGLTRVNAATGAAVPLTRSDTDYAAVATVTLTLPGPGFVQVIGVQELVASPTDDVDNGGVTRMRLRDNVSGALSPLFTSPIEDIEQYGNGTAMHLFQANAAGVRTFTLEVNLFAQFEPGPVTSRGTITALYIAGGGNGLP